MQRNKTHISLLVVNTLVAITAIGGGIMLVTGVDKYPAEWLNGTPFNNYLIPGMLLTVVVGGSAATASFATLLKKNIGPIISLIAGTILMIWIVGEILVLNKPSLLTLAQIIYFVMGLMMTILGLKSRHVAGND